MTLHRLTMPQLERLFRTELKITFPPAELRPLSAMKKMTARGVYHPYAWEEGGDLLGYAFLWNWEEKGYLLLDYLGVPAARRGQGLGEQLLAGLRETFSAWKGVFGEVEAPDGGEDDGLRLRRLAFYRRCGFTRLPYDCVLFGVHYQTLLMGGDPEREGAGVMDTHRKLYQSAMPGFLYRRMIQIPLETEQ